MYVDRESVDPNTLYQGDIISEFPFFIFENSKSIRKSGTNSFETDETTNEEGRSLFAIEAKKQLVLILSQTCDIQRRSNIIICPIYDLNEFIRDNTINADRARDIRSRKIQYWFYLPRNSTINESIADFQTMIYVPRSVISEYINKRILTLSSLGRHHLSWSLATYFGRPIEIEG
jgi:hypothetical protein